MADMTEEKVKEILRNRDAIIESIHKKIFQLYKELENNMGIESLVLSSKGLNEDGGSKKGGVSKDLSDFLLNGEIVIRNQKMELRKMLWKLTEDEQDINRVWACYLSLPTQYYNILTAVYVENGKWTAVEQESGYTHSFFAKLLKAGLQEIISIYNSDKSIADIMVSRNRLNK